MYHLPPWNRFLHIVTNVLKLILGMVPGKKLRVIPHQQFASADIVAPQKRFTINLWRRIREPFPLPMRLEGHKCTEWEQLDIGCAGCRECGLVHICDERFATARPEQREREVMKLGLSWQCKREETDENIVCEITGFCLRNQVYAEAEFSENVVVSAQHSPRPSFIEYDDLYPYVFKLLCSSNTEACICHEVEKADLKLQQSFLRILKEFKTNNPGKVPNIVEMVGRLMVRVEGIRLLKRDFELPLRTKVAAECTKAVSRLLTVFSTIYPDILQHVKREVLVTGIIYLMRTGLVLHDVTILPQIPELKDLLPLESYLFTHFKVKCTCITEIENVVKMHVRKLTGSQLKRFGVAMVDEILFTVRS